MTAYYNEFDPFAAAWLRELIKQNLIAPGDVDERSILEVKPDDLRKYTQVHFFAGIGGWSYALRLAGWPDDRPVWTGSCPCQPFSAAGKGLGVKDERHLWPVFFNLIRECRPPVVFGEQVASSAGLGWLSAAGSDLQKMRDREAVFGILRQLQGQPAAFMPGLRPTCGADEKARNDGSEKPGLLGVAGEEARLCLDECRKTPGESAGHPIQSGPGRHSTQDRSGEVRVDGDSVRSFDAAGMERALARPDHAGGWIYETEHSGGSLFAERNGEHLGGGEDFGDCVGDYVSEESRERAIAAILDGTTQAEIGGEGERSVFSDLEGSGYAVAAVDLCAAGVGAPHIRQRLWWVGQRVDDATGSRHDGAVEGAEGHSRDETRLRLSGAGRTDGGLADAKYPERGPVGEHRQDGRDRADARREETHREFGACGEILGLAGADGEGPQGRRETASAGQRTAGQDGLACGERPRTDHGLWRDADWLFCRDGKWRPAKRGIFPLVNGVSKGMVRSSDPGAPIDANATSEARVMRLRGYGNAIVPQVAATFIESYLDARLDEILS